ncbi:uncharacterized protein HMPREF1541_03266 [Cyphellophora europaea CBS 101466]|uniref:Uncharacterized protein n=1 Tax=Cyphellophora europaea (strain CBS 101466) TaxID=1220924 RepID=W2RXU2_CYPE1|nr:uncharacterized protein HMPREF1541_03266 [Cyphellophora europaea CBS 101466]ETN41331.1 hypothetical protein HMPREF1541_03266 [Cyphellophora europaea CBS 101466]
MSKQYLALHSIDNAHPSDVFALATTSSSIISASGDPTITIHSTSSSEDGTAFPLTQVLSGAHALGCHHLATSPAGTRLVSVGFGGELKIWDHAEAKWSLSGEILDGVVRKGKAGGAKSKAGEVWAVAISADGAYVAATTADGGINVWDVQDPKQPRKLAEYASKGSFGMCVDLSADGRFVATGTEGGNAFVFSTSGTGRLLHSLPGLVKPVRAVKFSPGSKLLAAAGDARVVSLYDAESGEQVANLQGHEGWITSLDWSATGAYLLSGGLDGRVKVWDVEVRKCVATHSESEKGLWAVKWLPKGDTSVERGKAERFVTAGAAGSVAIYREATGG